MSTKSSSLTPSANEFVPGKFQRTINASNSNILSLDTSISSSVAFVSGGMNLDASEWVPLSGDNGLSNTKQEVVTGSTENEFYGFSTDEGNAVLDPSSSVEQHFETMVEVNWNGNSFFVPESLTYIDIDGSVVYAGPLTEADDSIGNCNAALLSL